MAIVSDKIWICPLPMDLTRKSCIMPDFIPTITQKTNWPTVFGRTAVYKTYIEALGKFSDEELAVLGRFVTENHLPVAVELGGIRMAAVRPAVADEDIGVESARIEWPILERFIALGGRVDYITTDHALAEMMTGRNKQRALPREMLFDQMMQYFTFMREKLPELRCGAIESLGFFTVEGTNGRLYQQLDPSLIHISFEEYFDGYLAAAQRAGIPIDHFHIDFGMQDVETDGGADGLDYGRVISVETYVQERGVQVGFIAANAFSVPMTLTEAVDDWQGACRSAAERTLRYFEGYMRAGGRADYLILQRWQPYPIAVGTDEDAPYGQLAIFKSMVTSPWMNTN